MLLIEIDHIKQLLAQVGLKAFFQALNKNLKEDFKNWQHFDKSPRHAIQVDNGILELMPVCGPKLYSFKYVNGHPTNAKLNKPTIYACGLLAHVATGEPMMISEMTLLTALRTAATSALASSLLAKPKSKILAIIGCGAQSEFQVLAHHAMFNLNEVHYFDLDPKAMARFAQSMHGQSFKLIPGKDTKSTVKGVDIIITATAAKKKQKVLEYSWIEPGQHISGIGGDSPGKTELDPKILKHSKIVVEYFPQTHHEGEIQNLGKNAKKFVHAELWQIIAHKKTGRKNLQEITLFDSVGFALEDYSILRLIYDLALKNQIGRDVNLTPTHLANSKDLFSLIKEALPPQNKKNDDVTIIGYASGIAANNPDCGLGPLYLRQHQASIFNNITVPLNWGPIFEPQDFNPAQLIKEVTRLNTELAERVAACVKAKKKFCVFAGDHSSAIGTWSGVAKAYPKGDIGLIWIDAHMDSHTPESSETGNIHGMPVAHLLGYGIKNLKEILSKNPKIKPENICFIGIRSYEAGEAALLEKLGVKIFYMHDINTQGLAKIFAEAFKHISQHSSAFGITIDLDAMDPTDAPGVGCRESGGIIAKELINTLNNAQINFPFVGLEISEYNPLKDENQKTAKLVAALMEAVYGAHSHFLNEDSLC